MTRVLPEHLRLGRKGEELAEDFLRRLNLKILARNWRPAKNPSLELDIIAQEGDTLVFAEVKSRFLKSCSAFTALDNFSPAKQKRLRKAVALYLAQTANWLKPCRFDLICVSFTDNEQGTGRFQVDHYKNVLTE